MNRTALWLAAGLTVAFIIQLLAGNVPVHALSFPLNLMLLVVLLTAFYMWQRRAPQHHALRTLGSLRCSVALMALLLVSALLIGLIPQQTTVANPYSLPARLGLYHFSTSWPFVVLTLLLTANLWLTLLRTLHRPHYTAFRLIHAGLLVAIIGLSAGAADQHRLRLVVPMGGATSVGTDDDGSPYPLGYSLTLTNFSFSRQANGTPDTCRASLMADGRRIELEVNQPWTRSWMEKVYLVGYDEAAGAASGYVVVEVVRQPWRMVILLGIVLLASGAVSMFVNRKPRRA